MIEATATLCHLETMDRASSSEAIAAAERTVPPLPPLFRIGKRLRHRISAIIARSSTVGNSPVHDPRLFPWIAGLEARWPEIHAEVDALLAREEGIPPLAEISPDHRRIAPPGKWKSFFLYGYGYRNEENCARCPNTADAVSRLPGLNSAFFSILAPGAHIPRHRGVTKAILTAHLGIVVPARREACRMQVDEEMLSWKQGEVLVFDDTYHHEVWNDTDEQRVILLIQFRRPTGLAGRLLGGLFLAGVRHSRFVQDARSSLGDWEKAMQKLERDG
ncbi:MAG TPA: aspartyl/asparaginyl beta-hydroxylase domain-containing protein [Allosphingosinicella sp.]